MTKKALQLCTASATDDLEPAAKVIKFGKDLQACIAGLEEYLEEPLKTKFAEVKNQINTMLAGLPDTDKVPAALASNDVLRRLLDVFSIAQSMITSLSEAAKTASTQLASTRASMPTEITSAIESKVKAGEFITKADHEKAIADATAAATTSARAAAMSEFQVISNRKLALTTASIPVPSDELLAGDDKAFDEKQDTAKKRADELKPYNLPAERVLALAWNTDEAAYQTSISLMKSAFEAAGKKPSAGANGFVNRDSDGKSAAKPKIGIC